MQQGKGSELPIANELHQDWSTFRKIIHFNQSTSVPIQLKTTEPVRLCSSAICLAYYFLMIQQFKIKDLFLILHYVPLNVHPKHLLGCILLCAYILLVMHVQKLYFHFVLLFWKWVYVDLDPDLNFATNGWGGNWQLNIIMYLDKTKVRTDTSENFKYPSPRHMYPGRSR